MDGLQGFGAAVKPLFRIKIRREKHLGQFVLDCGNVARLQSKVKLKEPDVKWRQTQRHAVSLVVTVKADDEFLPEIVALGFLALADPEPCPGFDRKTGSGSDVVIR